MSSAKAMLQKSVRDHQHVYLVNVGVNLSHKLCSPIFPDARFEFVPRPEEGDIGECVRADTTPITRQLCDMCMKDKENRPFDYSKFRSLDACIGAYTRAVRPHFKLDRREDLQRFHSLLEYITTFNDMPAFVP